MEQISVFSPNTGKYGPGKTPYLDTFHAVIVTGLKPLTIFVQSSILDVLNSSECTFVSCILKFFYLTE